MTVKTVYMVPPEDRINVGHHQWVDLAEGGGKMSGIWITPWVDDQFTLDDCGW